MTQTNYEYAGMMAQFWDLLRGDTSTWSDRFFFKEVVTQSGQPVLDVGCGTGRLLLDFMQDGIDIDGMDNSPEMLDLCRQKAAQLGVQPCVYLQTMETLALPRQYQTIIVPSSSFQLLIEPDEVREAMHRFFTHLLPGGTLVMPFFELWSGDRTQPTVSEEWTREVVRPEDGVIIRRWSHSTYDLINNLEHTQDRYEVIQNGAVVASQSFARSPATRGYTQAQAVEIYQAAGFGPIRLTSDFTQEPAKAEDTVFVVWGVKPRG